ncbi:MAG: RNA polymerase factor sigma-54 [Pikeienuella sp.]
MSYSQRLEMRQSQQLVMTPQLQQAIRLLQMSSMDVASYVAEEVEKNPILSTDNGEGEAAATVADASPAGVDKTVGESNIGQTEDAFDTGKENLYESASAPSSGGAVGESTNSWANVSSGGGGDDGFSFEDRLSDEVSLRDHLLEQLSVAPIDPQAQLLARLLVDELDDAGYLRTNLDDLRERLGAADDLVERAVAALQACEPTGVGARDLKDCLRLQLVEKNRYDPAMAVLLDRLEDLAAARIDVLKEACGVDAEDLRDMISEIRELDPRPGSGFIGGIAQTVIPDVFVKRNQLGGWSVEVNADALPKVLLDTRYAAELDADGSTETVSFVAECKQNAAWLIRALDQRAQTILKVAAEIIRRQTMFFHEGVSGLKPMTLKMVADEIDMHESTVSRVTANKYLSTERGLFEMKFFFTQAISSTDGKDSHSSEAVRHQVKSLIDNENIKKTLSDDHIVKLLKESGVNIARRTVAKYREAMNIPSSVQRRRLKAADLDR